MNCPYCQSLIDDSAQVCPYCNNPVVAAYNPNQAYYTNQTYPNYAAGAEAAPKKKMPVGAVVGFMVALVAIIGAVVAVMLFNKGGSKKDADLDGKYVLVSVYYLGEEVSADMYYSEEVYLEIDGDEAELGEGDDIDMADVELDGDTIILTNPYGDEEITGEYDADDETISIDMNGATMIFEKE